MKHEFPYYYNSPEFHAERFNDTKSSAEHIVTFLNKKFNPSSVCDVGCGVGGFPICLYAFKRTGCRSVLGIDMDWVDPKKLVIDAGEFLTIDLTKPFSLSRHFDLCISLEVAEHLPASSADTFIESLCRLSDLIVFSAAIPGQDGFCHVNEQWQSYWADKFLKQGYLPFDQIRKAIWDKPDIHYWYRQNIMIFAKENAPASLHTLRSWEPVSVISCLDVVHPDCWVDATNLNGYHYSSFGYFLKHIKKEFVNFYHKIRRNKRLSSERHILVLKRRKNIQ